MRNFKPSSERLCARSLSLSDNDMAALTAYGRVHCLETPSAAARHLIRAYSASGGFVPATRPESDRQVASGPGVKAPLTPIGVPEGRPSLDKNGYPLEYAHHSTITPEGYIQHDYTPHKDGSQHQITLSAAKTPQGDWAIVNALAGTEDPMDATLTDDDERFPTREAALHAALTKRDCEIV